MKKLKAGGITLNHKCKCLAVSDKGKKYKNHILCSCGAYGKAVNRINRLKKKMMNINLEVLGGILNNEISKKT